jgi:hypothetical protein
MPRREDFELQQWTSNNTWSINYPGRYYLHSDGSLYCRAGEYWPTKKGAQAVLDKYYPPHEWVHGDVFKNRNTTKMIYIANHNATRRAVYCVEGTCDLDHSDVDRHLDGATFLFNIREKL